MKKISKIASLLLSSSFFVAFVGCSNNPVEKSALENKSLKEEIKNTVDSNKVLVKDLTEKEEEKLDSLLGKSKENNNYSYELVSTINGTETHAKLWRKGNNYKLDIDDKNDISIFMDNSKNEAFMYQKSNNIITNLNTSGKINIKDYEAYLDNIDIYDYEKKPNQIVDSKNCAVFQFSLGEEKENIYIWKDYGIIIKVEVYKDEKIQSELLFKDYTVGNVTDDMVNLPKEATYVDWKP